MVYNCFDFIVCAWLVVRYLVLITEVCVLCLSKFVKKKKNAVSRLVVCNYSYYRISQPRAHMSDRKHRECEKSMHNVVNYFSYCSFIM